MSDTKIQWHPAFIAAMNLEMADCRDSLRFDREYNLNVKPLTIDLLACLRIFRNTVIRYQIPLKESITSRAIYYFQPRLSLQKN